MHTLQKLFIVALILLIPQFALAENWKIDPAHTAVEFKIKHLMISWVKGTFTDVQGAVVFDEAEPEKAAVNVQIATASVDTGNKKRDDHLKSPDFFDAAKYPKIRFTSIGVKAKGSQFTVKGNLTMHGKTKLVSIPFKVAKGKNGAGVDVTTYKGKLTLDRNEFGIGTDSIAAKISLEDEVEIELLIVTFQ